MLLTLYGSLRREGQIGHYLHPIRRKGVFHNGVLPGLRIYVAGAVPGAVITNDKNDYAEVEYIQANLTYFEFNRLFELLDEIEGVADGLYQRDKIETPEGNSWIYTICNPEKYENMPVVHDWLAWLDKDEDERRHIIKSCNPNPEDMIGFL